MIDVRCFDVRWMLDLRFPMFNVRGWIVGGTFVGCWADVRYMLVGCSIIYRWMLDICSMDAR